MMPTATRMRVSAPAFGGGVETKSGQSPSDLMSTSIRFSIAF
jgi:hypothetical protein